MKKTILLLTIAAFASHDSWAQKGLMNKLKEAASELEQASSGNSFDKPNDKEVKKDIEATDLDKLPTLSDSRNISGIYYAHTPIRVGMMGSGTYKWAKKFHINYEEGDKQFIVITSRYSLLKGSDLPPLVYGPRPGTPDYFPVTTSKKMGNLLLDGITDKRDGSDGRLFYAVNSNIISFANPPEKYIKQNLWAITTDYIFELEPGILVTANMDLTVNAKTPEQYKFLQENGTYTLFYKKEKESVALALTKEQVWDRLKAFYIKYDAAYKAAEGNNVELAKPIAKFKDEPSNSDLVKVCKERMAQMKYFTEELVYVYPVTSWENRYENIGIMGKTLTHRVMQVQAVLKENGVCKMTQFLIKQENSYQAGSSIEKFTGNPLINIGDNDKRVIQCDKAMKYKK